ncbi:MAG: YicC family protein [Phycisphaerales bacterium]|nr:YicC family protein [Phycisphaerales bacterium]
MILSMTGYGDAQYADGEIAYALIIKSVNNKYFKANIKLPEHLSIFETEVDKLLRSRLSRGSVNYSLRVLNTSADAAQELNLSAMQSYLRQLGHLSVADNVHIDLGAIVALPGVCQPPELDEAERQQAWLIIENLTNQTIDRLMEMRRTEGQALREDLLSQCAQIRQELATIVQRAPGVLREYQQRLLQRANELIGQAGLPLELDDVRREVALYAERSDINEEISRLGSHLDQFAKLCDSREPAGRKLDFLAQELLREANTIGSKANDAEIAQHIVAIKGAIDRLKEQVQNVE